MIDASVLVVGGGAIGGVTAAKLTGARARASWCSTPTPDHVERLQREGLRLDELGEERDVVIEADGGHGRRSASASTSRW